MTEDQLEQDMLVWLGSLGYSHLYGPDIAHDGPTPERTNHHEVLLARVVPHPRQPKSHYLIVPKSRIGAPLTSFKFPHRSR